MNAARPHKLDPELAQQLVDAAARGQSVPVNIDGRIYQLSISSEPVARPHAIWAEYDPEQVLAAIQRSASLDSHAEMPDLDQIVADIRDQRDQVHNSVGT